jgi:hypothetical protein
MLRGGGDSLGGHLLGCLWSWLAEQFAPQVLQPAQRLGGHGEPAPALGCPVQDRPDQRQAALLAGQPADDLDPAAGFPEGPLDQVGMPDALTVLRREQQVDHERVEVVGHAGGRGGVQRLPLGDEAGRPPAGLSDGGLALGLDLVEDRPVVPLDLALGVGGDLGDEVAADVDQAALMQAGRKRALDRRAQPLAAVGDDQQRGAEPPVFEVLQQPAPGIGRLGRPRGRPRNTGLPSVEIPQATSTGSALALGCILKNDPSRYR